MKTARILVIVCLLSCVCAFQAEADYYNGEKLVGHATEVVKKDQGLPYNKARVAVFVYYTSGVADGISSDEINDITKSLSNLQIATIFAKYLVDNPNYLYWGGKLLFTEALYEKFPELKE